MPTRVDIEAATPPCPRRVGPGTHSYGERTWRCAAAMTWRGEGWWCPEHRAIKPHEVAPPELRQRSGTTG